MNQKITTREISKDEMWINHNCIRLIEGNIFHITASGEQTSEMAYTYLDLFDKMLSGSAQPVSYLIDLNQAGKNSSGARKLWTQIGDDSQTHRIALFGLHPVALVLASFVIGVSNEQKMRFFKTEQEAMAWLKEVPADRQN
ncbi:SpoIIAA family protein [Sunxiuqinia sp. sy24]|uniref:SpoIIAA family protein n=1 Tax=Sunxiuqinia sp. sy24 TaxID=3461495 RepID=UPI0040457A3D